MFEQKGEDFGEQNHQMWFLVLILPVSRQNSSSMFSETQPSPKTNLQGSWRTSKNIQWKKITTLNVYRPFQRKTFLMFSN